MVNNFSINLRKLRLQHNLKQSELADKIGVTQRKVSYWESGKIGLQKGRLWLVAVILPIAYGGIIEVLQEHFFYPRTGDWMDWLADCIGAWVGIGTWYIGQKWHERRVAQ
jgi:transcriptional regulator with XRE-family HTH domain